MAKASRRERSPAEQPGARTTKVGAPPAAGGVRAGEAPRGIEVLVKKAAVDAEFKAALIEKRAGAAKDIELELDPAEAAMLDGVPAAQLEAIISGTKVDEKLRPAFLGRAAAVMIAALGAGASGCRPHFPELERISRTKGLTATKIGMAQQLLEKERALAAEAEYAKDWKLHEKRVRYLEDLLDKEKRLIEKHRRRAMRGTKGHRADRP